jgi:hypothetical protein
VIATRLGGRGTLAGMENQITGNGIPRPSFGQWLSDLADNVEPRRLRYYPLFAILLIAIVIAESRATWIASERLVLPLVYESAEPVYWVDNKGMLSNGDRLVGWKKFVVFSSSGISWMLVAAGSTLALGIIWPKRPPISTPPG